MAGENHSLSSQFGTFGMQGGLEAEFWRGATAVEIPAKSGGPPERS
jgi:hypothetical protein